MISTVSARIQDGPAMTLRKKTAGSCRVWRFPSPRRFVTLRCVLAAETEMISSALRIRSRFFLAVSLSESTGIRLSAVFRRKTTTIAYRHVLILLSFLPVHSTSIQYMATRQRHGSNASSFSHAFTLIGMPEKRGRVLEV